MVKLRNRITIAVKSEAQYVIIKSKLNCEVLKDDLAFEARWAVAGDSVVIQLVGKVADGDYMAFGLSADLARSRMVGGDVTVAWVDHTTLAGGAKDYFLDDKSQCSGGVGTCPDSRIREGTESVRLLNAALVNGYSIVTYQRSLHARDELDLPILTNQSQAVIWAVGPLNGRQEASYHHSFNKHNVIIDFARSPRWNCPLPDSESSSPPPPVLETTVAANTAAAAGNRRRGPQRTEPDADTAADSPARQEAPRRTSRPPATPAPVSRAPNAWHIPPIECDEPDDGVFYAQMGPTGGKRGYSAITGHVGWGISWYINGLLIPEINVVRGKTYTFVTEGGDNPEYPAKYHPFYITDDPVGGYEHKTPEERAAVRVFAGLDVSRKGEVTPTGTGRLCNWTPDPDQPPADEFASFGAYQRTLSLICDNGDPGVVTWTPGPDTPDTVYYQCYSHRYLGWKINVLDRCDSKASGSELVPSRILPSEEQLEEEEGEEEGELQSRPSIRVSTVVKPNGYFINDEKNAALKGFPDSQVTDKKVLNENIHKEDKESNTNPNLKSHEILNPPQVDFKDLHLAVESGEAEKKSTLSHFSKESFNYSQQNNSFSEFKENQTYQSTLNSEEAIQKLSLLQSSQHSDHGGLNLADPRRKPIIHATTPYSVMSSSNEDFSSSTHIPMDTQDIVQDLKMESSSTAFKAQESSDKGNTHQKPKDKFPSDSFSLNNSTKQIYFGAYKLAPHTHTIPTPNFPTTIPHTQMIIHKPHQYLPPLQHPIPHRGFPHLPRPGLPALMRNPYISTTVPQNYISGLKKPLYRMPPRPIYTYPFQRPFSKISIPSQSPPVIIPVQHRTSSHQNKLTFLSTNYPKQDDKLIVESTSTISTVIAPSKDNINQSIGHHDTLNDKSKTITVPEATTEEENVKLPIAINTGFHPESVVVEGGFKPIIQKKEGVQDRSSQGGDTDGPEEELETETKNTEFLEKEEEELISELVSEINEDKKENIFEGQQPELFEPIFIPSPPDRITNFNHSSKPHKNAVSLPHNLTPPVATTPFRNRKPNPHPMRSSRPSLRRPLYPTNIAQQLRAPSRGNSPSFRFQQVLEDAQDETAMAAERLDTYYLPPIEYPSGNIKSQKPNVEATIPPGTVVTYDGKSVVDVTLASSITNPSVRSPNNQNPSGTAALIRETPQFGPFRGEIPPPVPEIIQPDKIPQLRTQNLKKPHVYPIQLPQQNSNNYYKESNNNFPDNFKTTQLSLVRQLEQEAGSVTDDLMSEASEIKEFSLSIKSTKSKPSKKVSYSTGTNSEIISDSSDLSTNKSDSRITLRQDAVTSVLKKNEDLSLNFGRSIHRTKRSPSPHHHPSHTDDDSQSSSHNHEEHTNVQKQGNMESGAHQYQELKVLVIICLGIYMYL